MIPKIIHYCWFGGNPLPELAQKCIESWRTYCPDYEIKRWDETNFDVNCCDYVRKAYEVKMWAFVSDYARFKILYENGGVYFDTDVELIKPIDDLLAKGSFMGLEESDKVFVAPGLGLAANPGLDLTEELLDSDAQGPCGILKSTVTCSELLLWMYEAAGGKDTCEKIKNLKCIEAETAVSIRQSRKSGWAKEIKDKIASLLKEQCRSCKSSDFCEAMQ